MTHLEARKSFESKKKIIEKEETVEGLKHKINLIINDIIAKYEKNLKNLMDKFFSEGDTDTIERKTILLYAIY